MRKSIFCATLLVCVFFRSAYARVNILDPFHPGQDSAVGATDTYQALASFEAGEHFYELPFQFNYVIAEKAEAGGKWGVRSVSGRTGLSDLSLGVKYQFLDGKANNPAVITEAMATLPTGDYSRGLGLGTSSFWFHWALERKLNTAIGYFGIGFGLTAENPDKFKQGNIFSYHLGASMPYKKKYRLHAELKGFNHGNSKLNGIELTDNYQEVYLAPGLNYAWTKRNTLSLSVLLGLTSQSHDIGFFIACTL